MSAWGRGRAHEITSPAGPCQAIRAARGAHAEIERRRARFFRLKDASPDEAPPAAPDKPPRPWWRRPLFAFLSLVALDQILLWTCATRPAGSIRDLIQLTGDSAPPYFELRPGLDTTYASWGRGVPTRVHTNTLGFRDPERPASRPDGMRRVIATGDSITFGIGVDDEQSYPRHLQSRLTESGAKDIEVWNAGVPGYAMADHLGLLRKRLLPLKPDVVLLQLSRNDNALPMPLSPWFLESLRYSGFARVWMIFRFNFVEDPALFGQSFAAYVDECRRAGVRLVLLHEGLPEENRADVFRLAGEHGIPLVEIGGDAYPKLPDDPHYDPEGNRRVAARLVPEVLAALAAPPPR